MEALYAVSKVVVKPFRESYSCFRSSVATNAGNGTKPSGVINQSYQIWDYTGTRIPQNYALD